MSGLTSTDLQAEDIMAVRNATATSMKTLIDYITYLGAHYKSVATSSATNSNNNGLFYALDATQEVVVSTKASIPLSSTTYTDANELYSAATSSLSSAVTSGAYTKTLQAAAASSGAQLVTSAIAASVDSSAVEVTYPPDSSSSSSSSQVLSAGAIAGIVIGTVVGVVLIALVVLYFAFYTKKSTAVVAIDLKPNDSVA